MNPIEKNSEVVLKSLVEDGKEQYNNKQIMALTNLSPQDLSDAIDHLNSLGALESYAESGMKPFNFSFIFMKSRGRYLYNEILERERKEKEIIISGDSNITFLSKPLNPIGSPYGFTESDWENVSLQKEDPDNLYVVLGMQFESSFYESELLKTNVEQKLSEAVQKVNSKRNSNYRLVFETLSAGLGEHLFNEIARNIIGADIAVFESSDLNPNVMLELGVALTWGIRVLPIRAKGSKIPPSDISGQTWVEYEESFLTISDKLFISKLEKMIDRAMSRK